MSGEEINEKLKKLTLSGVKNLNQQLGTGSYGRVFTVKYNEVVCAAKEIHSILVAAEVGAEKYQDDFLLECIRCSELTHPNIVHFMGVYYPSRGSLPVMVMELMDESLTKYVEKPNISLKRKISILHDVAEGLTYLHTRNPPVIHRDLSPNNVLLKHTGVEEVPPVAKISDLGVARIIKADSQRTRGQLTQYPGTPDFMPPETSMDNPKYGTALDVFSFGGLMLHTLNQEWPTPKSHTQYDQVTCQAIKALNEIERRQQYLDKISGEAETLLSMIMECLANDQTKRPKIVDLSRKLKPLKETPSLIPALQSGCYNINWTRCASLPSEMYGASVAADEDKVYVMAGSSPEDNTLYCVYRYDVKTGQWDQLPRPGHYWGVLHVVCGKLVIIGGAVLDSDNPMPTNKVLTYDKDSNSWKSHYPNMEKARCKPGIASHLNYVIVLGGEGIDSTVRDDIEVLNTEEPCHWTLTGATLPEPMWAPSLTVSDKDLYIVGYSGIDWRYSAAYQIPVNALTETSKGIVTHTELASAPYWHTSLIPHSQPPIIVGGCDNCGDNIVSDIYVLDIANKKWTQVTSLSTARSSVGIAIINNDVILVIGGSTNPSCIDTALARSSTKVEMGQVKLN